MNLLVYKSYLRHAREGGHPRVFFFSNDSKKKVSSWMPAFAGMTAKYISWVHP
jgi:hypothetical protein